MGTERFVDLIQRKKEWRDTDKRRKLIFMITDYVAGKFRIIRCLPC